MKTLFFLLIFTVFSNTPHPLQTLEKYNIRFKKNKSVVITTINMGECKAMIPNIKIHLNWVKENVQKKNRILIINSYYNQGQVEEFFEKAVFLDLKEFNLTINHNLIIDINNNGKRDTELDAFKAYSSRTIMVDPKGEVLFNDFIAMLAEHQDDYESARKRLAKK